MNAAAGPGRRRTAGWGLALGLGWAAAGLVGLGWGVASRQTRKSPGDPSVATSGACRGCHPFEYDTWHATYHRTMTQRASSSTVAAPFGGEVLEVLGFTAVMDRNEGGAPRIRIYEGSVEDVPAGVGPWLEAEVEFTVGSHRYQQYVARIDRGGGPLERWRLPVAWHLGDGRWIHLSEAFLLPDPVPGDLSDYARHLSRWNDNCALCHNTEPRPGRTEEGTFDTSLGEVGIACEACHGRGSAHVASRSSRSWRGSEPVPMFHPGLSDGERSSEVCGRCHGNRIAHDLGRVLADGDGFVPGRPLAEVSRPIYADSSLSSAPDERPFAPRFWPDGTPRLSAYEFQALQLSACHDGGEGLQCRDCHTMHGADPVMQLRADWSAPATCGRCHPEPRLSEGAEHGRHRGVEGVGCVDCHMPRTTYGLVQGMIAHRITIPAPTEGSIPDARPDACTLCHVDRSRAWAARALRPEPDDAPSTRAMEEGPETTWASQVSLDLAGGDPIQRALAVEALGRPSSAAPAVWRMRELVDGLEDDYPAIRAMAWRALSRVALRHGRTDVVRSTAAFGPLDDPANRLEVARGLRERLGPSTLAQTPERQAELWARRDDRAIEIGE